MPSPAIKAQQQLPPLFGSDGRISITCCSFCDSCLTSFSYCHRCLQLLGMTPSTDMSDAVSLHVAYWYSSPYAITGPFLEVEDESSGKGKAVSEPPAELISVLYV